MSPPPLEAATGCLIRDASGAVELPRDRSSLLDSTGTSEGRNGGSEVAIGGCSGGGGPTTQSLSNAMILLAQHLEQERKERASSLAELRRNVEAQQVVLAQIAEQLIGGKLEETLGQLRADIVKQQEQQDLQAAALREALLDMSQHREDGKHQLTELNDVKVRCETLATQFSCRRPGAGASEDRLSEDLTSMVMYHEQQFVELVKAVEMERSARMGETAELRAATAELRVEAGRSRDMHRSSRTSRLSSPAAMPPMTQLPSSTGPTPASRARSPEEASYANLRQRPHALAAPQMMHAVNSGSPACSPRGTFTGTGGSLSCSLKIPCPPSSPRPPLHRACHDEAEPPQRHGRSCARCGSRNPRHGSRLVAFDGELVCEACLKERCVSMEHKAPRTSFLECHGLAANLHEGHGQ